MNSEYKSKYLKYKLKYMALKELLGGNGIKRKAVEGERGEGERAKRPATERVIQIQKYRRVRVSQNSVFVIVPNLKLDKTQKASDVFYIKIEDINSISRYLDRTLIKTSEDHYMFNRIRLIATNRYYQIRASEEIRDPQCLQLAEGMNVGEINYSKAKCQYKVSGSQNIFGSNDDLNITRSQQSSAGIAASPSAGESYAIVRQLIEAGEAPFHIAHVILVDGNNTLTIESDATNPDMKTPLFDMYTIRNERESFHGRYKEIYTTESGIEPNTIVLTPR